MTTNIIIQGIFTTGEPRPPVAQPSMNSLVSENSLPTYSMGLQLKPGVNPRDILRHEERGLNVLPGKRGNNNTPPGNPGEGNSLPYPKVLQNKMMEKDLGGDRNGTAYLLQNPPPRSAGQALPVGVQAKMESIFGADLSDVRVHIGLHVSSIGALAYTHGNNIHFAPGQYNPMSIQGQRLLGHELTHVIQQRAGKVANPFGGGTAVVVDHALESEADRMGRVAASGPPVMIQYMK